MKKRNRKLRLFFIVSGILLSLSCAFLSTAPALHYMSYSAGWTQYNSSYYADFSAHIFLAVAFGEIFLLFMEKIAFRKLAIVFSLAKAVLPWILIWLYNFSGTLWSGSSSRCTVVHPMPYIVTGLAVLLLIQHIIMFAVSDSIE